MQLAHVASFVHKWLALLVGVQIVFWVASGLFFTLFPIQQIRSENLIRPNQAQTIDPASLPSLAALRGKRVLAFAGIGDPARFVATLRQNGIDVASVRTFPDHHPLTPDEAASLVAEAEGDRLMLVTTEKDLARLRTAEGLPDWARAIVPFKVTLQFDDAAALRRFVSDRLFAAREMRRASQVGSRG